MTLSLLLVQTFSGCQRLLSFVYTIIQSKPINKMLKIYLFLVNKTYLFVLITTFNNLVIIIAVFCK